MAIIIRSLKNVQSRALNLGRQGHFEISRHSQIKNFACLSRANINKTQKKKMCQSFILNI
jgi:hypothetical protein